MNERKMSLWLRRAVLALLLVGLACFTTGCEWMRWLRLLSFKKQLAELECYVRAEDKQGLTLRFLKPAVYAEDLQLLMEGESMHITNQTRQAWQCTYEKQSLEAASVRDFDLTFGLGFEGLKLTEMVFSERFLAVLPKAMILGMLRSIGRAELDIKHSNIKFKWAGAGQEKLELPTKRQVTALLGPPFLISETNGLRTFLYKYYEKTADPESPAERLAWARFSFEKDQERILSSEGAIGNMGWSMATVPGQPEMRITVALTALSVAPVAIPLPAERVDEYVGHYEQGTSNQFNIGHDGEAVVFSWDGPKSHGWCLALPELTNTLFALPSGEPRCTFQRNGHGAVTGMVLQAHGSDQRFARVSRPEAATTVVRVGALACQACAGAYKASWGGRVTLSCEGEQLFWQSSGIGVRIPLYPASETNFFFKAVDSPLTFVKDDKGKVTRFILHYRGHTAEAERLKNP